MRLIFLLITILSFVIPCYSSQKVFIIFNGERGDYITKKTINKIDYVSAKDIVNIFSGQLYWYRVTGKLVIKINNHSIGFFYGTKKVNIDEKKLFLKYPSILSKNTVYIPFEFILSNEFSNAIGLNINYNEETNILEFDTIPNINQPRIYSYDGYTRIIFNLNEQLSYKINKESDKIFKIIFYRGIVVEDVINYDDKFIQRIELSNSGRTAVCKIIMNEKNIILSDKYDYKKLEFILDFKPEIIESAKKNEFLELKEKSTYNIMITTPLSVIVSSETVQQQEELKLSDKKVSKPHFIKRIVIDPGHGGEDSGAIGPNGTEEKTINLDIGLKLKELFEKDGYEVFLTRDTDVFIPLVDRTQFANEKKADIFISIHCNASPNVLTRGWEIYFLSEKATDTEAAETAALENSVIKFESQPTPKQLKLQELLWSLVVNEFMNESSELAAYITKEVVRRLNIENRGVKQAGFFVLRGAQMPAVLVECAFISNVYEEAKLKRNKFKNQICDAIYSGVKEYDRKKTILAESNKKGG